MEQLIIIGAGASGLMAGAVAASNNVKTLILEHTENVGKKILSTGNGKCNMTNFALGSEQYYCQEKSFVQSVLNNFGYDRLIKLFNEFGLVTRDRDGYVYPYSEQAAAVREILVSACDIYGVTIQNNCNVSHVVKKEDWFEINTDQGVFKAKNVIIATGGKSFAKSGSDGSGYKLARDLGHTVSKTVPALTSLICHEKHYKQISGVRAKCKLEMYDKDKLISQDTGELQLTDYGISGIPVFNISREAAYILKSGRKPYVVIDFMREYKTAQLKEMIMSYREKYKDRTAVEQISYLLNKKLATFFVKTAGIKENEKLCNITENEIETLISSIKHYKTYIANIKGFEFAQVTAGGVVTNEINPLTMESLIHKNLYFAGEIIDVDGRCGGYNLHFAWATAYIATMSVVEGCTK